MRGLSRRLTKLEMSFGAELPEDLRLAKATAMDRAIQQAPLEVLNPLYECVMRVYGRPGEGGPDTIELAEFLQEATPIEQAAIEALVALAESLPQS